ncbi:tripartite motif-containing protein 3 [Magallana gigas]|uniref:tripartite motif-containing protein 3 n=1 Tax=Magallana gigas TaxID=29159 RepID=UPI00333F56F2
MAISNPVVSDTIRDEPVIAQHFLVCGNGNCEENCQFYCNPCHLSICKQCRDEHQKNSDTKNHEVVPYRQRTRELPVEKCKDHPTKEINILCEDCQAPLCYKCALQNHQKHNLADLETIYSKGFTHCLDEIHKIHQHFLPTTQDIQTEIKEDAKKIKAVMDKIRESMKSDAESLKRLVDSVTSDNIEQVNKMEESLMENLQSEDNTYRDYISFLEDFVKKIHAYLSSTKVQNNPIIFSLSEHLNIQPIPKTTKPVPPVFIAGQYCKEDVIKLLGRVTVPDAKTENREIKPMETASSQLKPTGIEAKQVREKADLKQTLSLSSSVIEVLEYKVPGVGRVRHISLGKSGTLWSSDHHGNLVQTDLQGNRLQDIQTSGSEGYHTVTQDGNLIYTDTRNKVINMKTVDNTTTEFIKTGDWDPIGIYSSNINGDILVGMIKDEEAKVTRYNKTGEEIQNIQRNNNGQEMYKYPHYITENINGDICTSDLNKHAVVVVNKSGQHRFSYTGQRSVFSPYGICSDLLSHIIVCDSYYANKTVDILDQDGQFLSRLTTQQGVGYPCGVCVDDENNLQVGQYSTNTVTVYKYLQ